MAYKINLTHQDKNGRVKLQRDLEGSHRLTLANVGKPLDVSLIEIAPIHGDPVKNFRLILTDDGTGERSGFSGTWAYEILFHHQRTDGLIDAASMATGSHFTKMSPRTPALEVTLDDLPSQPDQELRLHFVLKDKQ